MRDIMATASESYDIKISRYANYQDGYILNTDRGKLYFKETGLSPERIRFIHGAKQHLYKNGLKNIDLFLCTRDGEPFFNNGSFNCTLNSIPPGRESDFDRIDDVCNAAEILADMHNISQGYRIPGNCHTMNDLGSMYFNYQKKIKELKKLSNYARRAKGRFDYLFLKHLNYYIGLGEKSVEKLKGKEYEDLVEYERKNRCFCHHDFSHRNLFIEKELVTVTGFDYCRYEIRVFDLADLIRKRMRRNKWIPDDGAGIIRHYTKKRSLSPNERVVLKQIIRFPHNFWRVANKFYNSKRCWAEKKYTSKLIDVLDTRENYDNFIKLIDHWL